MSSAAPLVFAVNGNKVCLPANEVDPSATLNDFIRRKTKFSGTKLSCGEGGCGACAVDLSRKDSRTGETTHISVNSCLRPLASMDGWAVTTTEGIGGPKEGFHPIQERIAGFNGLQCGFCTPGMVMTAYSNLAQTNGEITPEKMEKAFDGNICRCTGYRPILDACKSLTNGSDIEDFVCNQKCNSFSDCGSKTPAFPEFLEDRESNTSTTFEKDGKTWIRPAALAEVFDLISKPGARMVVANTSVGIYKDDDATILIDLQHIPELLFCAQENRLSITIGASNSIARLIEALEQAKANCDTAKANARFLEALIFHCERIANVHVRNVGSIAGNLALAKSKGFVSDLATLLLGANATVTMQSKENSRKISMEDFLATPEWNNEIIRSITIPFIAENQVFNSYKTAIRPVNSHALINASFLVTVIDKVLSNVVLAFGGVQEADKAGSHAILAKKTSEFLNGKELNAETLREALKILNEEIQVQGTYKKESRTKLVSSFFYKFYLSLAPIPDRLKSGSVDLFKTRPTNKSSQKFSSSEELSPVNKAVPKTTGPALASGSGVFIDDLPSGDCVFGALVTSTCARGKIVSVDPSEALKANGVIDFVCSGDVPGSKSCSPMGEDYPFFASAEVEYFGQPIGLLIADTLRHAEIAAKLVIITYDMEGKKPVLTTDAAKEDKEFHLDVVNKYETGDVNDKLAASAKKLTGTIHLGSQKHFYMEPQVCDVAVDEDGCFVVQSAGQFPHGSHVAISKALDLPQNKVRLICRRAGGGFGGKLTHNILIACITAVASYKTQLKVRVALNRNVDMRLAGGREETTVNYEVGCDNDGKIVALKMFADLASGIRKDLSFFCNMAFVNSFSQAYDLPSYHLESKIFKTNQAPRTAVRGPSEISSSWCMETILEHISHATGICIDKIREINFIKEEDAKAGKKLPNGSEMSDFTIPKLFKKISDNVNEDELIKSVEEFNSTNRWKKRGIAKTPVRYEVNVYARSSLVNVYADGSIIVHHGTSDIGQGANVKVLQAVSQRLGTLFTPCRPIDMNILRCAELDTTVLPNCTFTGGSTSSESSCEAAQDACDAIIERLKPILTGMAQEKQEKGEDVESITWESICGEAAAKSVNLGAVGYCNGARAYQNFGGCLSAVEVDILTGEVEILESHLLYDCGKSLNPAVDIGQAEGAFVMGLGFLLREEVEFDEEGKLINDGTWEYKPPCYRDIPQVFNIELLADTPFEKGYLSSKASGEPPLVLANSVGFAVRQAIRAARIENGLGDDFFILNTPLTVDVIQAACGSSSLDLE